MATAQGYPFNGELWRSVKEICNQEKLVFLLVPSDALAGDVDTQAKLEYTKSLIRYLMVTAQCPQSRTLLQYVRTVLETMVKSVASGTSVKTVPQIWNELLLQASRNPFT